MSTANPADVVGEVWRAESARIVAGLARLLAGDVGMAEEIAHDAVAAALEQWPREGVPANPAAWLTSVARRRAVDALRRIERRDRGHAVIAHEMASRPDDEIAVPDPDEVDDDVLRLMFVSCHPLLATEARVALTLRLLGGLRTDEIARAFLVTETTIAQRIVRAKRALAAAQVRFEVPAEAERAARLESVLDVVYLVFNEGYTATEGDDWMRPALCAEALRLGRLLADLVPGSAQVHGLVALMELQASRSDARTGPAGEPVLLHEQDRDRWDRVHIRRGFVALLRARAIGEPPGRYVLEAAIAACHAGAPTAEATDWAQIAALYELLVRMLPTPVVALNRAVAVAMASGPAAGLELADALVNEPALAGYALLPGVRGDLLSRMGRHGAARVEFERAATLTRNVPERAVWLARAREAAAAAGAGAGRTLGDVAAAFLADLEGLTARSYGQTLTRLRRDLGEDLPVADLTAATVAGVFATAWAGAAPATWNRHRGALRSFAAWAGLHRLDTLLDRRSEPRNRTRPLPAGDVAALAARAETDVRERTLWWLVHESGVSAERALALDVDQLELSGMRTSDGAITWGERTAALLPRLVAGRSAGPVFLAERRAVRTPDSPRTPAAADLCPETGRRRLSYERAAHLFKHASGGHTLRQLRPGGAAATRSGAGTAR